MMSIVYAPVELAECQTAKKKKFFIAQFLPTQLNLFGFPPSSYNGGEVDVNGKSSFMPIMIAFEGEAAGKQFHEILRIQSVAYQSARYQLAANYLLLCVLLFAFVSVAKLVTLMSNC